MCLNCMHGFSVQCPTTVADMRAQVYEAQGELMAVTLVKVRLLLPPQATFLDYLARPRVPDVEAVVPVTLTSAMSGKTADPDMHRADSQRSEASLAGPPRSSSGDGAGLRKGRNRWLQRRSSKQQEPSEAQHRNHTVASRSDHGDFNGEGAYVKRTRVEGTGRRVKARLWLSSEVPINQRELLPLLDLMGTQNQYLGKVCVGLLGAARCKHSGYA
jgi:hypothetical protein